MSNNNGDMPAMPARMIVQKTSTMAISEPTLGFTKREHFAAMAMQGLLSNPGLNNGNGMTGSDITIWAVQAADSLLEALDNK